MIGRHAAALRGHWRATSVRLACVETSLASLTADLASGTAGDAMLSRIVKVSLRLLHADVAALSQYDARTRRYHLVAVVSADGHWSECRSFTCDVPGDVTRALLGDGAGAVRVLPDDAPQSPHAALLARASSTALYVALRFADEMIGVLHVVRPAALPFTECDRRLACGIGDPCDAGAHDGAGRVSGVVCIAEADTGASGVPFKRTGRLRSRVKHDHAVLLVEDDLESRDALAAVLEAYGFLVCEAIDGQDALDQLAAGYRPCAILLDLMMPRMDGWEFREHQRRSPELSHIPVALLTAAANVRLHASRLGVDASFSKPVDLDGVVAFVDGHCADH